MAHILAVYILKEISKVHWIRNISFNILINDKGVFHEIEEEKSINVVVGGVNYNEIANTIKIHDSLNKNQTNFISMLSFADEKPNNITSKQSVILPYATDITIFPGSATAMFNLVFGELANRKDLSFAS